MQGLCAGLDDRQTAALSTALLEEASQWHRYADTGAFQTHKSRQKVSADSQLDLGADSQLCSPQQRWRRQVSDTGMQVLAHAGCRPRCAHLQRQHVLDLAGHLST